MHHEPLSTRAAVIESNAAFDFVPPGTAIVPTVPGGNGQAWGQRLRFPRPTLASPVEPPSDLKLGLSALGACRRNFRVPGSFGAGGVSGRAAPLGVDDRLEECRTAGMICPPCRS